MLEGVWVVLWWLAVVGRALGMVSVLTGRCINTNNTPLFVATLTQGGYGGRLGTTALRTALATLLSDLTQRSLPALVAQAQGQLGVVRARLQALPPALLPPQADPVRALLQLLDEVCGQVGTQLASHGGPLLFAAPPSHSPHGRSRRPSAQAASSPSFWVAMLGHFSDFKREVYSQKPQYLVGGALFSCLTDSDLAGRGEGACSSAGLLTGSGARAGAGAAAGPPTLLTSQHMGSAVLVAEEAGQGQAPLTLQDVHSIVEAHRGLEVWRPGKPRPGRMPVVGMGRMSAG